MEIEWWCQTSVVFKVMNDEWWVMSNEWQKLSDENWVMKKNKSNKALKFFPTLREILEREYNGLKQIPFSHEKC